jgi:hypothetical protein
MSGLCPTCLSCSLKVSTHNELSLNTFTISAVVVSDRNRKPCENVVTSLHSLGLNVAIESIARARFRTREVPGSSLCPNAVYTNENCNFFKFVAPEIRLLPLLPDFFFIRIVPGPSLSVCLSVCLSAYGSTTLVDLCRFFNFLIGIVRLRTKATEFSFPNLYIVGTIPWMGDQSVARPLPTHRTTQTQNKRTQVSMPLVGFELTFERAKAVRPLDREATVMDSTFIIKVKLPLC